jgi:hypothetical protein
MKNKPYLYLDMDGVLCDFYGKLRQLKNGTTREDKVTGLANSSGKDVFDFFSNLEPLPGGIEILNFCKNNNIEFTICSAPLRGPFYDYSILGKKQWLDRYAPGASNTAVFTSEKYLYAKRHGKTNVLVDDLDKNIVPWNKIGGIAIKHKDSKTKETIQQLQKIFMLNK